VIAKHEPPAPDPQHHGHLTALSISPRMRALGLARVFMAMLERLSSDGSAGWGVGASSYKDEKDKSSTEPEAVADSTDCVDAWFVDLFVRCNNHRAIDMYERLGYSIFRRVVE
jgi:N-terminal acetyltransferase B complex catalytic subunit